MPQHKISLAISSDSDDAVMVYAMQHGLVDCLDYSFVVRAADIQELNEMALDSQERGYDVSALSAAAFAHAQPTYELLPIGASMGFAWGPAVVVAAASALQEPAELAGKVIAVPGRLTSALATVQMVLPEFEPLVVNFAAVGAAVCSGAAQGGVLIHEAQLGLPPGLKQLASLHELWQSQLATQLPLPLGVIGVRARLSAKIKRELAAIYRASIAYGLDHLGEILPAISADLKTPLTAAVAQLYIERYVGASAMEYTAAMRQGMELWLARGATAGLWPEPSYRLWPDWWDVLP